MACGILVPWSGIESVPFGVETWSLNHWTARGGPALYSSGSFLTYMSHPSSFHRPLDLLTFLKSFLQLSSLCLSHLSHSASLSPKFKWLQNLSPTPTRLKFQLQIWADSWMSAAAAAAKSLHPCPTVQPHRRQPTRLLHPWDSPGKNTAVGCRFLLQCMHAC